MLKIVHITASPFFGGPERQMLELGRTLEAHHDVKHVFASFPEGGNCEPFLQKAQQAGFETYRFENDMPHLIAATREMVRLLQSSEADIFCAHGHKARILGRFAVRKCRVPIIGVSRGWTTENLKIHVFTFLDKRVHRRMDHVVCVSQGQADKVLKSGTPKEKVTVIRNSIRTDRFDAAPDPEYRAKLEALFPGSSTAPKYILGDAGRLSPEKGFDLLVDATAKLVREGIPVGLVVFGEGFLLEPLQKQIDELGVQDSVVLAGFTDELDKFMPHFDVFVQSSHTEGLPNVLLEAMAAQTAVVATEVGGTNEVVVEGETGFMVPPNDSEKLAQAIRRVVQDDSLRQSMGENGRSRVEEHFTFEAQAAAYWELFQKLNPSVST